MNTTTTQPFVETLRTGYRAAYFDGAVLIVRPDGSESFTNVSSDSALYAILNDALFS